MKPTIKDDCMHAYAGIVVLVDVFMVLFVAATHGQELPNAPQAAVKHQTPPVHKLRLLRTVAPRLLRHVERRHVSQRMFMGGAPWPQTCPTTGP